MRLLHITPPVRDKIKTAIERAKQRPIPWDKLKDYVLTGDRTEVKLSDRRPGFERVKSHNVLIPYGYRAAISYEEQPHGIMRHLSISIDRPGFLPTIEAVEVIAKEFGFLHGIVNGKSWIEEFAPGHEAVNIIEVAVPNDKAAGVH